MIIDSKKLSGPCVCGRTHQMATKAAFIEADALLHLKEYLAQYEIGGKCTAVYDKNTYAAVAGRRPKADAEIILDPTGLHADEHGVEALMAELPDDTEYMLAIGSGTIHDLTRYCAYHRGIPFVACPTAASVDGFCSTVAAMTWGKCKKTMPAAAPVLVVADLTVIAAAPLALALSGVGDMVGKVTALADWRLSHIVTGEHLCEPIFEMTDKSYRDVLNHAHELEGGSIEAFEKLTYGLVMVGLAMQLYGNSRPASGAEHHLSHCIEMEPAALGLKNSALHGEKVGVASALVCGEYHRMAEVPAEKIHDYVRFDDEELMRIYGPVAGPGVLEENRKTDADTLKAADLAEKLPEVREVIAALPTRAEITEFLQGIGAKATLADIGVAEDAEQALFTYAPAVRTRLTMLRLRRMMV